MPVLKGPTALSVGGLGVPEEFLDTRQQPAGEVGWQDQGDPPLFHAAGGLPWTKTSSHDHREPSHLFSLKLPMCGAVNPQRAVSGQHQAGPSLTLTGIASGLRGPPQGLSNQTWVFFSDFLCTWTAHRGQYSEDSASRTVQRGQRNVPLVG